MSAESVLQVADKAQFLSKYASLNSQVEETLVDVLLTLDNVEKQGTVDNYKILVISEFADVYRSFKTIKVSVKMEPTRGRTEMEDQNPIKKEPSFSDTAAQSRSLSLKVSQSGDSPEKPHHTKVVDGVLDQFVRKLESQEVGLRPLQLKSHTKMRVVVTEVHSANEFWVQPISQDLELLTANMRFVKSKASICDDCGPGL